MEQDRADYAEPGDQPKHISLWRLAAILSAVLFVAFAIWYFLTQIRFDPDL